MFLNGGERQPPAFIRFVPDTIYIGVFYGHNGATTNLELIARFFEKYPEYSDRAFLSIKVSIYVAKSFVVAESFARRAEINPSHWSLIARK